MLIKRTLLSIPTYCMFLFNAPAVVIGKLKRLQRNFLWDAADEANKIRLGGDRASDITSFTSSIRSQLTNPML